MCYTIHMASGAWIGHHQWQPNAALTLTNGNQTLCGNESVRGFAVDEPSTIYRSPTNGDRPGSDPGIYHMFWEGCGNAGEDAGIFLPWMVADGL
jgi:hypothetical protein